MPRFSPQRFPPGFFDLPHDAGGSLPLDMIAAWIRSPQTAEAARALLGPVTLRGTVVSTDAAGLTQLGKDRSMIEMLALVSRPKELVHAYGRAIGGTAVGVWAADNTAMFYREDVAADGILGMLLALMAEVRESSEIGIGVAAHHGTFYELGSGLHGVDADLVENLAENHASAGEVILTSGCLRQLREASLFRFTIRADLAEFGEVFQLVEGPRLENINPEEFRYPIPFPDEFHDGLSQYQRTRRTSVVPQPAYREGAVVVVERAREERDLPEVAALNDLALAAAIARAALAIVKENQGMEIKNTGGPGFFFFPDPRGALDFARSLRTFFGAQAVPLAIGIDVGRVVLFDLGGGRREVAGSPVNLASKLAQDAGILGSIALTAAAAQQAGLPSQPAIPLVMPGGLTIDAVRI